jgi:hypothetical protein
MSGWVVVCVHGLFCDDFLIGVWLFSGILEIVLKTVCFCVANLLHVAITALLSLDLFYIQAV